MMRVIPPYLTEALLAISLVDDLVALALSLEAGARTSGSAGVVGDAAAALAVLVVLVADGSVAAVHVGRVVAPRLLLQPVQLRRPAL